MVPLFAVVKTDTELFSPIVVVTNGMGKIVKQDIFFCFVFFGEGGVLVKPYFCDDVLH